jgi:hypothetical protein
MRLVFCTALLAAASFAQAQSQAKSATGPSEGNIPEASSAPPAKAFDSDEKICKVGREIGSNKLKRICRTRAQIEADRESARETLVREQQQ